MVRSEFKKINISLKQNHLIDIYSNTANYLELGTIGLDTLVRLLNYEMVQLDDIAYLPIQNSGFSQSSIKNESLKSIIPYFYFQNINQKNRPNQVFITHGMIGYKDSNNMEVFSPLVLIPVNIFFENGRIYFQQVSEPVENTVLINKLQKERKINIPIIDKLDNIFQIDKFIAGFEKHEEFRFELENFLTFASIQTPEHVLNLNKFNLTKAYEDFLYENLYSDEEIYYYSKKYNRNQRYALMEALNENSLVITGRLGTGKTTVLKDIAINAIAEDKKVLYISNMKETLDEVYEFFESKDMHYYVTNFSDSFSSFHNGEIIIPTERHLTSATNFDVLLNNYKFIKDYQHAMTGRILDYRFIDVINELILLEGKKKSKLKIDNLDAIYKYEYLEILDAVENIQVNLTEMDDFKNCVWKEIPLINDIKYPNQVISLIHKVHSGFVELDKYKNILEDNYGFKEVGNYAFLKNIIHNFFNININEIPKSWYEKKNYELARSEYHKLKTLLYTLNELEYDLDIRFDNLDRFDIRREINNLYGDFFTENDLGKINKIIKDRLNVVVKLNKALVQVDIFNKSYSKIKSILNYDFDLDNAILAEIVNLAKILLETNINSKIIKTIIDGKFNSVYEKASNVLNQYLAYHQELEHLFDGLPLIHFGSFDDSIKVFENYSMNKNVRRIQKRVLDKLVIEDGEGYNKVIAAIARYHELNQLIIKEKNKFNELLDYSPDQIYIDDFKKVNEFLESISNLKVKSKIIRFLKKIDDLNDPKNKNFYRFFDYFYKSYYKLNNLYNDILVYEFTSYKDEFAKKIHDIQKINNYVQKSFHSNDVLYSLKKINTNEYVTAEDYYYIHEAYNKIAEIKKELATNKDFQFLFGNMYNQTTTDLSHLSKVIQAFRLYTECFNTEEAIIKSLSTDTYESISETLEACSKGINELNELFKLYFKIFKNSVSRAYYAEFVDNIKYLNELLRNKETLIIYLRITQNLQVLAKHQLYKFIEYIVYLEDESSLVNDFKYTYLTTIKDIYLKKYPYLANYKAFEASLNITVDLEDEIIQAVEERIFQKIRKKSGTRFSVFGVRNLDYNGYIRRTNNIKHLFLANTQVVNKFLNIKDFDLVIIDDAHLFDANEYSYALQGSQVVVAGELQLHEAVANNLISRISLSKNIVFNYRYSIMPKGLKNFTKGLMSPTYKNYYDNHGVEVITKDVFNYVSSLFKVNKDFRINLFTSSLMIQRKAYDFISNLLYESGFEIREILNILSSQINISDLNQAYLINADYNIVFLDDYYKYNEEYLVANMIDNLLLCKNKLIIFDQSTLLESEHETNFLLEVRKIIKDMTVFTPVEFSGLIDKLVKIFEANKIDCFASELASFTFRVNSNIYGLTIYWDSTKTNYDILNEFRDVHSMSDEKLKKIFVVWAMELVDDFEVVVQRILEEVDRHAGRWAKGNLGVIQKQLDEVENG